MMTDLRYALRSLRRRPLFAAVAILTLGLGIGATTTLFTIVDAVLLRPLPFRDPSRIVSVSLVSQGRDQRVADTPDIAAWEHARTLTDVTVYTTASRVLMDAGGAVDLRGTAVTGAFFHLFGMRMALGRGIDSADAVAGAARVIVLSHRAWLDRFGGDPAIVGRMVQLSDSSYQVIGVAAQGQEYPAATEYWLPFTTPTAAPDGVVFFYSLVARLAPHQSVGAARAELSAMVRRLDATRPAAMRGSGVVVMPLHDRIFGAVRPALVMLFAAVAFLLLIACANVANLMLARGVTRRHDGAVRIALGQSGGRMIRELLAESVTIAALGAALGLVIPFWAVDLFVKLSPDAVARAGDIHVNVDVLLFATGVAVLTGLLCGAAPAWSASRGDALDALRDDARTTGSAGQRWMRNLLVGGELAVTLVLLTGAGLFTRSFVHLLNIDLGYTPDHLSLVTVFLPSARYQNDITRSAFFDAVAARARTLPGVTAVALSDVGTPDGLTETFPLPRPGASDLTVGIGTVDRNYARTAQWRLLAGRFFDTSDRPGAAVATVITASAAQALFPHGAAVGKSISLPRGVVDADDVVVVGVVPDTPPVGSDAAMVPRLFFSREQVGGGDYAVLVRSRGDAAGLEAQIRRAVASVDPRQPVSSFRRVDAMLAESVAPQRLDFLLISVFAGLALLLSGIGLYGVMAFGVAQRQREMGIRVALGATGGAVQRLVLKQGLAVAAIGCAAGIVASLALSRLVGGLLYGVSPRDPLAFVLAPLVLMATGALACYLPARRATRVDPVIVMKVQS